GDDQSLATVTDCNEQVIRARFADAAFFINEDIRLKLEDFVPQLSTLIFQFKLGSMLDRSNRIEKLAGGLATGCFMVNFTMTCPLCWLTCRLSMELIAFGAEGLAAP
ncbi:MAG: glycine--tRNA ligase subunit beta, partial [Chloroflexi bacterium]|nr:glycine--tRNA ligase subunit beta [Chloroflexota bacterium]